MRRHVLRLHEDGQHAAVIAMLDAALLHGQPQPWMYEVLALSMEIEGRPKEDVERVLLSISDFGAIDFDTLLYSAAYLIRFDRHATAVRLYRQASSLQPERTEPYLLALPHAEKLAEYDDVVWSACGILRFDWSRSYEEHHRQARDALQGLEQRLRRSGDAAAAELVHAQAVEAALRDLEIAVVWSGDGDVDLDVEEPLGTVCSFAQPETAAGGFHLFDGFGPEPENCREHYVCPEAVNGAYRVRVRRIWGKVVGDRVSITVTRRRGAADETQDQHTLVLDDGAASLTLELEGGRRQGLRNVSLAPQRLAPLTPGGPIRLVAGERPVRRGRRSSGDPRAEQAAAEFAASRGGSVPVGAAGFLPIIQTIQEGATLSANAIISPDRRYVRIGVSPVFNNITDVFTFSVFGGSLNVPGAGTPAGNLGGP